MLDQFTRILNRNLKKALEKERKGHHKLPWWVPEKPKPLSTTTKKPKQGREKTNKREENTRNGSQRKEDQGSEKTEVKKRRMKKLNSCIPLK